MDVNEDLEKRARGGWGIIHRDYGLMYCQNNILTA